MKIIEKIFSVIAGLTIIVFYAFTFPFWLWHDSNKGKHQTK